MTDAERIAALDQKVALLTQICDEMATALSRHLDRTERQNEYLRSMLLTLAIGVRAGGTRSQDFGEEVRKSLVESAG